MNTRLKTFDGAMSTDPDPKNTISVFFFKLLTVFLKFHTNIPFCNNFDEFIDQNKYHILIDIFAQILYKKIQQYEILLHSCQRAS